MTTHTNSALLPRRCTKALHSLLLLMLLMLVLLAGCHLSFEDNATHLANALAQASKQLRASHANEALVVYETLDNPEQSYYVEITASINPAWKKQDVWGSYIVVSGKTSGGTSYHNRFVYVPQRLIIRKEHGGATEIVLRKHAGRIDVVALR
ncbi:MAG: hypothetical protein L0H70_02615 [Xanthomonadales bacterium]|nr:hypothetical protein [Xanthomonadales bacterium]